MTFPGKSDLCQKYSEELCKVANERFGYRHCLMVALESLGYKDPDVLLDMAKRRDIDQFKTLLDFTEDFKKTIRRKMTPELNEKLQKEALRNSLQYKHDRQTETFKAISSAIKAAPEDMAAEAVMLALVGDKIPHVKLTLPAGEMGEVFSKHECVFNYCPTPDLCKEKGCQCSG